MKKETMDRPKIRWRKQSLIIGFIDVICINLSMFLSLWIRYDFSYSGIPLDYLSFILRMSMFYTPVCIIVFALFKLYNRVWRYVGMDVVLSGLSANAICISVAAAYIAVMRQPLPVVFYVVSALFQICFTIGIRLSYRVFKDLSIYSVGIDASRVMIIGAGEAGMLIIRELRRNNVKTDTPVCIIDDNPNKWGRYMDGIPIEGGRDCILSAVEKYKVDKIVFAIPSASAESRRDILSICTETNCILKQLPKLYQGTSISYKAIENIGVEDLLGREPIKINTEEVFSYIEGKKILVTGGGGSIGSELCRQIAAHNPKTLIIFDIYENNAYNIQIELKKRYPFLDLVTIIGSVRDSERLNTVFAKYKPEVVFHAAAHKHVPLMEENPCEAIKNNVFGTYKTAYAAMKNGCRKFVLISTDKAVNPTNVMGASKRLCEMIVQSFDKLVKEGNVDKIHVISHHYNKITLPEKIETEFVAVRFGNVLGSNGSVVPIFKQQIENGENLTVTHPDIIRYFMTISEAVSLVLQAGAYAQGGEIFVLDMGSPVKIDTLARNMIKLAGLRPDVDIKIVYTGLRPGEKLFEEKLMESEGLEKTANELIFIGHPVEIDEDDLFAHLRDLLDTSYENDEAKTVDLILKTVPTYYKTEFRKTTST